VNLYQKQMWPKASTNNHIFADDDYDGCRRDAAIILTHKELTPRLVVLASQAHELRWSQMKPKSLVRCTTGADEYFAAV
jgi:hypothetical protein